MLVEKVEGGYDDSKKIANNFKFEPGQSNYYRQAGELLGIIRLEDNRYYVTDAGKEYLKLNPTQKKFYICKLIPKLPIFHEIFTTLISDPTMEFNKEDIVELIKIKSNLTGDTPKRRAGTILSWCKWVENNFGVFKSHRQQNR